MPKGIPSNHVVIEHGGNVRLGKAALQEEDAAHRIRFSFADGEALIDALEERAFYHDVLVALSDSDTYKRLDNLYVRPEEFVRHCLKQDTDPETMLDWWERTREEAPPEGWSPGDPIPEGAKRR